MSEKTKLDKRIRLMERMEAERANNNYGDKLKRDIVPAQNLSPRQIKAKRKKLARNLELSTRPEPRASIWIKMTIGSSFMVLAFFAIPISVALLVLLATIPEVIRDLAVLPSTIITVTAGTMGLLFVQSALISTIIVFVMRLRNLRLGTIITFCVSLASVLALLNFLLPIFRMRPWF